MELSKRLQAVADLVHPGAGVADIGTDHAYIPIWLVSRGRTPWAVAMDVNEGPLMRARENIREAGLEGKVETRISDGFAALRPGEADTAVLAGMGGALMIRILREGADVVRSLKECVLQPQSEIEKVRTFLLKEDFSFIREDMAEEDGKYYPMMCVRPPSSAKETEEWTDTELQYGRLLLTGRHPVLRDYLEREIRIRTAIIDSLKGSDSYRAGQRIRELRAELECAEKGLEYYDL